MQTKHKAKPVKDLRELRLLMANKIADFENGDLEATGLKAITGAATVIVNTVKIDLMNNHQLGVAEQIDFLEYAYVNKDNPQAIKGITNDIFEK